MVRGGRFAGATAAAAAWLAVAFLLAAAVPARGEVRSSVTLSGYAAAVRAADSGAVIPLALIPLVKGSLDLQSAGNENVRGFLQLDAWAGKSFALFLPRAYVKVRLPWFRLTVGKTRVSWGDGFLFNAGDVVFGSMDPLAGGLSESLLRDETAWLAALYAPLGPFSYLEGVLLPWAPVPAVGGPLGLAAAAGLTEDLTVLLDPVAPDELAGGVRGVFRLGGLKLEAGYFGSGRAGEHRPYLSLQGHLGVDWNLAAALNIPTAGAQWESWAEWLDLSAGAFWLHSLPGGRALSLRLEGAVRPGMLWQEAGAAEAASAEYALYLFPEVIFSPTDTLSVQARALISPLDGSALCMAGVGWSLYQGLELFTYLSVMAGDPDDLYAWDRDLGFAWILGLEFVY